jgi:hypothetical protein
MNSFLKKESRLIRREKALKDNLKKRKKFNLKNKKKR